MILTTQQRELRWQIEKVAFMGIHAIEYFNGVTGKGSEFWMFTQNCYGERGCHLWCQLFNSYNKEPTHYFKLFGNDMLANLGVSFNYNNVKKRLIKSTGLNEERYLEFRKSVINFRNMYSAHREYETDNLIFPELDYALEMLHELRDILSETVEAEENNNDDELKDLCNYYKYNTRNDLTRKCRNDISAIQFF